MNSTIENTYWVIPDKLLAGEYPASADPLLTKQKLALLKQIGINRFIDLTTSDDNLDPYDIYFDDIYGDEDVVRHSFPIKDYSIPESREFMRLILDAIDLELLRGRRVYVHCWGGIGRTGTVIGCYLARYCGKEDPLSLLADLWAGCTKSKRYPESPQTAEQINFVKEWNGFSGVLSRAQGALIGQFAGDSLGSLVEFSTPDSILNDYPAGLRDLADGGTWKTIAGQPTDDSELALLLARHLVDDKKYDSAIAFSRYRYWLDSDPFDCGNTIASALSGVLNTESQANGALMRISPLGIYGGGLIYNEGLNGIFPLCEKVYPITSVLADIIDLAKSDAALTHPHPVCLEANALYAAAISIAVSTGAGPGVIYEIINQIASALSIDASLHNCIINASKTPPDDFIKNQGWVIIAFQNALFQLLNSVNPEEGIVDTVMKGGDTDTNAAIAGALVGAVHGIESMPERWIKTIINCRPEHGLTGVYKPRPEVFWPVDVLVLAEKLISINK